jgi:RHS repeat-associated protein
MPASPRETVLCRYHYDALDRLDSIAPSTLDSLKRFYCKTRLATEIQGSVRNSIFQHEDQLLAQQRHENARIENTLLATDQQRSVLNALSATGPQPVTYTAYGHRSPENGLLSLLGFNGERRDPLTGHYPLGNGYRQFNPVTMRFNSPDSLSPFGDGGLNAYAYCVGDPVNRSDPTGHFSVLSILIGVSGTVTVGAVAGAILVEDEAVRSVLSGLAGVTGVITFGAGLKHLLSRPPRLQRSNVSLGRMLSDPPPPYPDSLRRTQPAANRVSFSEQPDVPPPSYEEAIRRMDGRRDSQNVVSQLSLSPHQQRRRTLSSSNLSPSDITQEARDVRRSI